MWVRSFHGRPQQLLCLQTAISAAAVAQSRLLLFRDFSVFSPMRDLTWRWIKWMCGPIAPGCFSTPIIKSGAFLYTVSCSAAVAKGTKEKLFRPNMATQSPCRHSITHACLLYACQSFPDHILKNYFHQSDIMFSKFQLYSLFYFPNLVLALMLLLATEKEERVDFKFILP